MNVIPKPQKYQQKLGKVDLKGIGKIEIDQKFDGLAEFVQEYFGKFFDKGGDTTLKVTVDEAIAKEGYSLDVDDDVSIAASSYEGAFYALQTLRIMSYADCKDADGIVDKCHIEDKPEFSWRGLHLDESRHFFGKEFVKKYIDMMAMHKLNVLHWHLTDDQGWRIEIKKYPLLTEIGSKREKSNIHGWHSTDDDGTPVSGFYTQEDAKEVVEYAQKRGIIIVPEIDMPAHFQAAFAAYPHLACREKKVEVAWYFGGKYPLSIGQKDWNRSACIGKPTTMQFIYDVIDEICEMFPAPYFHIGGDEAPKEEWKNCEHCQALIKEKGLKDEKQLQGYFINQVQKYLATKNKRLLGWNEVLEGKNLDSSVVVQYWVPTLDVNVKNHLNSGGQVVLSKHKYFYFDMPYAQYPLQTTYSFQPYFDGIKPCHKDSVLGVEGTVWTEWIATPEKLNFQLYPRMEALSEVAWNQNEKNWKEFKARLDEFKPILTACGIGYAKDEISCVRNLITRAKRRAKWYNADENVEFDLNK